MPHGRSARTRLGAPSPVLSPHWGGMGDLPHPPGVVPRLRGPGHALVAGLVDVAGVGTRDHPGGANAPGLVPVGGRQRARLVRRSGGAPGIPWAPAGGPGVVIPMVVGHGPARSPLRDGASLVPCLGPLAGPYRGVLHPGEPPLCLGTRVAPPGAGTGRPGDSGRVDPPRHRVPGSPLGRAGGAGVPVAGPGGTPHRTHGGCALYLAAEPANSRGPGRYLAPHPRADRGAPMDRMGDGPISVSRPARRAARGREHGRLRPSRVFGAGGRMGHPGGHPVHVLGYCPVPGLLGPSGRDPGGPGPVSVLSPGHVGAVVPYSRTRRGGAA